MRNTFLNTVDKDFIKILDEMESKYPGILDLEGIGKQLDINTFSQEYFKSFTTADVSVDANSNVGDVDVISYNKEAVKPFHRFNSLYCLWKKVKKLEGIEKANEMITQQLLGQIYICDLHGASSLPYCFNYSTYDIMTQGLSPVKKIKSVAPKYLYSFKSQLEQFVIIASNSTLGATGLADLFIVMSHYVKNILDTKSDAGFHFASEEDCWKYVKENIVSFIYTINQPMRGEQSAFTNVSVFDKYFLEKYVDNYPNEEGELPNIDIIMKIQELYLDVMNEELQRTPITFPVTTACFSINENNEIQDEEFLKMISEKNQYFGFINIYCGSTATLSSCCRLRSNTDNEYFNSLGSSASKIGSLGVVTINLPHLAYLSDNKEEFLNKLSDLVDLTASINNSRRNIILDKVEAGAHPLYTLGFIDINKQYSTTGLTGLYEALEILGYDILTKEGQDFTLKILEVVNNRVDINQKKYSSPHNVEQVPAENMAVKLPKKDTFIGINKNNYNLYSNQFIPLVANTDLINRIKLQGLFDSHFSGGAICHLNVENKVSPESQARLIRTAALLGVVYFAINLNLLECENHHMTVGHNTKCSICGKDIINSFTRVVGFLTNTKNWNKVRREEDYHNRVFYDNISEEDLNK